MVGPIFGGVLGSITYRLFTYEPPAKELDGGNQVGGAGDAIDGSNAVFVTSDTNSASYDEITIDDDVKAK